MAQSSPFFQHTPHINSDSYRFILPSLHTHTHTCLVQVFARQKAIHYQFFLYQFTFSEFLRQSAHIGLSYQYLQIKLRNNKNCVSQEACKRNVTSLYLYDIYFNFISTLTGAQHHRETDYKYNFGIFMQAHLRQQRDGFSNVDENDDSGQLRKKIGHDNYTLFIIII